MLILIFIFLACFILFLYFVYFLLICWVNVYFKDILSINFEDYNYFSINLKHKKINFFTSFLNYNTYEITFDVLCNMVKNQDDLSIKNFLTDVKFKNKKILFIFKNSISCFFFIKKKHLINEQKIFGKIIKKEFFYNKNNSKPILKLGYHNTNKKEFNSLNIFNNYIFFIKFHNEVININNFNIIKNFLHQKNYNFFMIYNILIIIKKRKQSINLLKNFFLKLNKSKYTFLKIKIFNLSNFSNNFCNSIIFFLKYQMNKIDKYKILNYIFSSPFNKNLKKNLKILIKYFQIILFNYKKNYNNLNFYLEEKKIMSFENRILIKFSFFYFNSFELFIFQNEKFKKKFLSIFASLINWKQNYINKFLNILDKIKLTNFPAITYLFKKDFFLFINDEIKIDFLKNEFVKVLKKNKLLNEKIKFIVYIHDLQNPNLISCYEQFLNLNFNFILYIDNEKDVKYIYDNYEKIKHLYKGIIFSQKFIEKLYNDYILRITLQNFLKNCQVKNLSIIFFNEIEKYNLFIEKYFLNFKKFILF